MNFLNDVLGEVLSHRPADPIQFLSDYFGGRTYKIYMYICMYWLAMFIYIYKLCLYIICSCIHTYTLGLMESDTDPGVHCFNLINMSKSKSDKLMASLSHTYDMLQRRDKEKEGGTKGMSALDISLLYPLYVCMYIYI